MYVSINSDERAGVCVSWREVGLQLGKKTILERVSGDARPGELLALMGPSGAGKTTLLNVLSGRLEGFTGRVATTGMVGALRVAYIAQEDVFLPQLTASEHLEFLASLLIAHDSPSARAKRVARMLDEYGLAGVRDTRIGFAATERLGAMMRGISGGERKRLALASAMVGEPSLIFADEPTTGLDSTLATSVVRTMSQVARGGGDHLRTVLASVHQPGTRAFALFDTLVLLAHGRVAYCGPAAAAAGDFERLALLPRCAADGGTPVPPSELLIELVSPDDDESRARLSRALDEAERRAPADDAGGSSRPSLSPAFAVGFGARIVALLRRAALVHRRSLPVALLRVVMAGFFASLIGLLYLHTGRDLSQTDVQDVTGCLFMLCTSSLFSSIFPILQMLIAELPLVHREHRAGAYDPATHLLSKMLADAPLEFLPPLLLTTVVFGLVGFRDDEGARGWRHLGGFAACVEAVTFAGSSMGYAIAAAAPDLATGALLTPMMVFPCILLGGLYANTGNIPQYYAWFNRINPLHYGFVALSHIQWEHYPDIACDAALPIECPFADGKSVLAFYSLDGHGTGAVRSICLLLVIGACYRALAFAVMLRRASRADAGV